MVSQTLAHLTESKHPKEKENLIATSQPVQTASAPKVGHFRAFTRLIVAALYFLAARLVAQRAASGLLFRHFSEDWSPLLQQAIVAFLLLVGYACLGWLLERQSNPVAQQGLVFRSGWFGEFGSGFAVGWAIALACVLPLLVFGGIALHFYLTLESFRWLAADTVYFLLETLTVQIAFRGYPAACATRAFGEIPSVLLMSMLYALLQAQIPGASLISVISSVALGLLMSLAYIRTRALWLPWGLQFGWLASRALLFGLPVEGVSSHSPVVQGYPAAASWLSGADFGLDGSWISVAMLLLAMPFVYQITRELNYRYNAPILIPGGIPVDLDAAARRQHDTATRADLPEVKPLVQILPATASPAPPPMPERIANLSVHPNPFDLHASEPRQTVPVDTTSTAGEPPIS